MGLFDTFIVDTECPSCKGKLSQFQSKSFGMDLQTYKIKERLIYCPIENGIMKRVAYSFCKACRKSIYVDVKIKKCRFIGIGKPIKEEQYQKEEEIKERLWKKSKKYKQEQKRWRNLSKIWGNKKFKKGKFRYSVSINLKQNSYLIITDKKGQRSRYRIKKSGKNRFSLKFIKNETPFSWDSLLNSIKKNKNLK